jgi:hypothetical protein
MVAIGLVGIAQPAYATPPTVSVQFTGAECAQVGDITTIADGDTSNVDVKFACAGRDFLARFYEITLDSGATIELEIALPSNLKFTQITGSINTAWGEECLDPTYKVGGTVNIDWGSEGSFNDPEIQYLYSDSPDSEGNFAFDLPLSYTVFPNYPAQDPFTPETWLGQSDQAAGDEYAAQCNAGLEYGNSDYAVKKGGTFQLFNQTAEMNYRYNFPPGLSETDCNMDTESLPGKYVDARSMHWGTTVTVNCMDLFTTVGIPIDGDFTAGQSYLVDVDIPPLNWVTVTGHVNFANPICQSFEPQIRTSASDLTWDSYGSGSAVIDGSGNFSLLVPLGSRYLSIDSQSSSSPDWAFDACNLSSRYSRNWHFEEDTSGLQLATGSATIIDVTLVQPDVNDVAESCSLYAPDEGDIPEGQALDELQTVAFGTSDVVNVRAYCGSYMRDFNVPFTRLSSTSGVAELQVPDLNITRLKGSISLPKGYPANRVKDLEVYVSPFTDQQDGDSAKGWYFESGWMTATLNKKKLTYDVEVVDGDYLFSVSTSAQPAKGCYLQSYFPGTALQFATPVRISANSTRGPKLALIHGGQIIGNATFPDSIRYTPSGFIDQVYDENGQSFAWRAGDGTGIASNGNFMNMLCLPPGDYYYQAGNPLEGVKSQFYPGVTSLAKASKIRIPAGTDSKRIQMAFTPVDRGYVSGLVLDVNGDPLSGYTVYAYDESSQSFQSTESAEDGSFELTALDTPSDYSIHAFDSNVYWGGSTSDYVYYPGVSKADAVPITLTESSPNAAGIILEVPGNLAGLTMWDLDPRYGQINVPAPAESFDGLIDDLLNGDVTLDMENEMRVSRSREMNRMITDYDLDVEVNFNAIDDSQVTAFSYATGGDAAAIGSLTLGNDVARVKGQVDLNDGINFVTVTGTDSLRTVALPIMVGDVQPTIASAPVFSGKLAVGKKVSTTPGAWLASPAIGAYQYQWKACSSNDPSVCVAINKQTKPNVTLTKKQKGRFLAVTVTATNSTSSVSFTKVFGKVK